MRIKNPSSLNAARLEMMMMLRFCNELPRTRIDLLQQNNKATRRELIVCTSSGCYGKAVADNIDNAWL